MTAIPVEKILPNPEQPREKIDPDELQGLAQSMAENGLLNPIAVEDAGDEMYILIDGHRRLAAAKLLTWSSIEANVLPCSNGSGKIDRLMRAIVANMQRADMSPIEEAMAFKLLRERGLSADQIAKRAGVSVGTIYGRLDLLALEVPIQELMSAGKLPISPVAVRSLLAVRDSNARLKIARMMAAQNASANTVARACGRLVEKEAACAGLPTDLHAGAAPSLQILAQKVRKPAKSSWNAMAQIGKRPRWPDVEQSAIETCNHCPLKDIASKTVCGDCQAVELILRLMEI